jgi:hypothetical protein
MPHAYTEDQLVEQPAIGLFAELGWTAGVARPLAAASAAMLAPCARRQLVNNAEAA